MCNHFDLKETAFSKIKQGALRKERHSCMKLHVPAVGVSGPPHSSRCLLLSFCVFSTTLGEVLSYSFWLCLATFLRFFFFLSRILSVNHFKDHISGDTRYQAELAKFCLMQANNIWASLWHQEEHPQWKCHFLYCLNSSFQSIGNWHLGLLRMVSHLCGGHSATLADGHECWHAENQYVHHVWVQ